MEGFDGLQTKQLGSLKIFITLKDHKADGGTIPAGAVIIPRRNASKPNVYDTIYDALRSRVKIVDRYGVAGAEPAGELGELSVLRKRLDDLQDLLLGAGGIGPVRGKRAEESLGEICASLKGSSNPLKADARDKAKQGVVRTANDKVNRGATSARTVAIDERLAFREDEVRSIAPWMNAMETALLVETNRCLHLIKEASDAIRTVRRHEFFRTGSASENQRRGISARLYRLGKKFETVMAAPFVRFRNQIAAAGSCALDRIAHGEAAEVRPYLDWILHMADRAALQKRIEDVIVILSLGESSRTATADLHRLRRAFVDLEGGIDDLLKADGVSGVSMLTAIVYSHVYEASLAFGSGDLSAAKDQLKAASRRL